MAGQDRIKNFFYRRGRREAQGKIMPVNWGGNISGIEGILYNPAWAMPVDGQINHSYFDF
jgi:hypothetical protein